MNRAFFPQPVILSPDEVADEESPPHFRLSSAPLCHSRPSLINDHKSIERESRDYLFNVNFLYCLADIFPALKTST
jgi:hypothetical protein